MENTSQLCVKSFLNRALFLLSLIIFHIDSYAQVSVIPSGNKTLCDVAVCFINQAAKDKFEKENNCVFANKCDFSVQRVKEEFDKIPKSDPTYGFYRNQYCIANKSCSSKSSLDNSKWLDSVVYDFINPLVTELGNWKLIKAECKTYVIFPGLQCQKAMAKYHISEDLQVSVNDNGCGTVKDWEQIGKWLEECIKAGLADDGLSSLPFSETYAIYTVKSERDKVRAECVKHRTAKGLPIEG
jgi:hypothetical protein